MNIIDRIRGPRPLKLDPEVTALLVLLGTYAEQAVQADGKPKELRRWVGNAREAARRILALLDELEATDA